MLTAQFVDFSAFLDTAHALTHFRGLNTLSLHGTAKQTGGGWGSISGIGVTLASRYGIMSCTLSVHRLSSSGILSGESSQSRLMSTASIAFAFYDFGRQVGIFCDSFDFNS